jgi:N-acetylmuramoyl-L-alanine amidase
MPGRICILLSAGLFVLATGLANAATVTTKSESVLRAGPGSTFGVIGHIPAGSHLEAASCASGWCQVGFKGTVGFVAAPDLGTAPRIANSPGSTAENVRGGRARISRRSAPSNQGSEPSAHALTPSALPPAHP